MSAYVRSIFEVYALLDDKVKEVEQVVKELRMRHYRRPDDVNLDALQEEFAKIVKFASSGVRACNRLKAARGYGHRVGEKFELRDDIDD